MNLKDYSIGDKFITRNGTKVELIRIYSPNLKYRFLFTTITLDREFTTTENGSYYKEKENKMDVVSALKDQAKTKTYKYKSLKKLTEEEQRIIDILL